MASGEHTSEREPVQHQIEADVALPGSREYRYGRKLGELLHMNGALRKAIAVAYLHGDSASDTGLTMLEHNIHSDLLDLAEQEPDKGEEILEKLRTSGDAAERSLAAPLLYEKHYGMCQRGEPVETEAEVAKWRALAHDTNGWTQIVAHTWLQHAVDNIGGLADYHGRDDLRLFADQLHAALPWGQSTQRGQ